jgi:hypothetical protein
MVSKDSPTGRSSTLRSTNAHFVLTDRVGGRSSDKERGGLSGDPNVGDVPGDGVVSCERHSKSAAGEYVGEAGE